MGPYGLVIGLGFRVYGIGFRAWVRGFRVKGLRVEALGARLGLRACGV